MVKYIINKIGLDKITHSLATLSISMIITLLIHKTMLDSSVISSIIGCLTGCIAGLAKEIIDKYEYGLFDTKDLLYDSYGAVVSLIITSVLL